ncbi:molybdopterin dinucleotide binding domain-containing protein [Alkalisalibacterium limincola]|uniref:molybdopterin dinucleotide binding domain-containing protein n=1 Tax=Alkalisalibacterium limincola TaxID=2699169 RepID=UPI003CCD0F72
MANRSYLDWSAGMGFIGKAEPIVLQLYSETLQKFRLAAQGHGEHQPPDEHRERVATYFDPLPIWYEPFEGAQSAGSDASHPFPLSAVTQRPMFMYHSWGSQNAWLRQIATKNTLFVHPDTAALYGVADGGMADIRSHLGTMTVPVKTSASVHPDTVWTWNAIGKRRGAWRLDPGAPEGREGFLLNHLISDVTPDGRYANADPVTGQAAWFDLRIALSPATRDAVPSPMFAPLPVGRTGAPSGNGRTGGQ